MKYSIGQLVVNKKLGLGKVLEVDRDTVTVFFRDEKENPRIINVGVAPMALAESQSDPDLDDPNLLRRRSSAGKKKAAKPRAAAAKPGQDA